jgi:hypothetical protein
MTVSYKEAKTARQKFEALDNDRSCALARKREHARLTIPSLLPPNGRASDQPLDVPYNTTTAEDIGALASRIMSVLFPLNGQPVFEIIPDQQFSPQGQDNSDLNQALSRLSSLVMDQLAPTNLRASLFLGYQHGIAIGDWLLFQDDDFSFRLFRFDQYVVRRKHEGDWKEIIIKEAVNPEWFPKLQSVNNGQRVENQSASAAFGDSEDWEYLYTHVLKHDNGSVTITQGFRDTEIVSKTSPVSPYMPMRWGALVGEAYGISLVEQNFGDIRTIDALAKAALDAALLTAEGRMGVNPAGITEMDDLLQSIPGDFVPAVPGEVFPIEFGNARQVQALLAFVQHRENMLDRKFLKRTTRQAERVTAREIAADAQDLEGMLGGVLSQAAQELQIPIIRHTLHLMQAKGVLEKQMVDQLLKTDGLAKLRVRAGLEILNREAEREKLDSAIERMRNLPPEALNAFIWTEIGRDWWESLGLESTGRVKTAEQMQAELRQQQQQALAQQAAMTGVQAGLQNQETTE